MRYRVNFGNGQVHYAGDRESCVRYIATFGCGFLEFKDAETGDWFSVRP